MTEMYSGLHVGQRFSSLEDFKAVVRSISVRQHWELRVTRSNKKSVVIGCRSSPNCFFRVVCRANRNSTYISSLQDSHSCRDNATSTTKTPARSEASHVRFLLSEIPKLFDMRAKIKAQDIVDAVKRYHGYDISTRQAQRALIRLQERDSSQQQSDAANSSSGEDRQESQPPPVEAQAEGSGYAGIPGQRWLPDVQPGLVDTFQQQQEDPRNPTMPTAALQGQQPLQPPPPPLQNSQRMRPTPQTQQQPLPPPTPPLQAPIPQQHDQTLNHTMHPQHTPQQPLYPLQTPTQPTRQPGLAKSPTQPQQPGHPSAPQLVLTNFKIEFSCTTCGALNQSFFPNQGNVTGGHYMPPRAVPDQTAMATGAGPVAHAAAVQGFAEAPNDRLNEAHRYDRARRASTRGGPTPWAPTGGPLDVPLAPPHTHNSPT